MFRAAILAVLVPVVFLGLLTGTVASAHADTYRARVPLSAAHVAPDRLSYLLPGARVSFTAHGRDCPRSRATPASSFSDVSAYRWDGSALGVQHWTGRAGNFYWRPRQGAGRVTYRRGAFRNGTRHAVLVAGWCG